MDSEIRGNETRPMFESKLIGDQTREIRADFITKVYGILSLQLVLTSIVASPFIVSESIRKWVATAGLPFFFGVLIFNMALLCSMMCPCCCENQLRRYPLNYVLLFSFTMTEGVLLGVICANYTINSVFFAVVATAALVLGLMGYAMYTKSDFTEMGPYLFAGLCTLFIFSIFSSFLPYPFFHKVLSCLGILLFSWYIIYDTQKILGKGEVALSIDEYVYGALTLYMDIIQLFLYILQLFGERR
eukprot:TRINITY_DN42939_c0_g1_i1.p1 TRINITY_DN42939_c0_g1~~TRINITY_DN42939_c0_g1_i1.p1  ORF type:complete len:273 (-),score=38.75 TRINITY_DN42939_c0_g1_i1:94-825(-)